MVVLRGDNDARPNTTTTTIRRPVSSTAPSLVMISYGSTDDSCRYGHSTTTIDGELLLLFRSVYRVNEMYRMVYTIISVSVHGDRDDLISSTTTIRRTLSSTVPSLSSRYSTTTIDGELIELVRSAYRVDRMYRTIAILQLVVLYEDKCVLPSRVYHGEKCTSMDMISSATKDVEYKDKEYYCYADITTDGELILILLFRLAYRVDRLSSIVLLLQSGSVQNDEDDTFAIMQIVVLYQVKYEMIRPFQLLYHNDDDTVAISLPVPYQFDDDTIAIMQLVGPYQEKNNDDDTFATMQLVLYQDVILYDEMKKNNNNNNNNNDDGTDTSKDNNSDKDDTIAVCDNIRCNDGDYCNDTMRTNGERTTCYSSQEPYMIQYCINTIAIDTSLRVGHFNDDKVKINVNTSFNNNNSNYWYNNTCYFSQNHFNDDKVKINVTLIGTNQNGEYKEIEEKEERMEEKYQSRALHSQGQYKNEVYNAEEGMFQEPILRLDYHLVIILMYTCSRTSIGDGDETTSLISTTQNGENKKIDDKKKRMDKYTSILVHGHVIPMIRLCLCFLLIVTMRLRLYGQSMGSVKIHKDRLTQVSQTRARLEARLEVNREPLESCIQSDVFVCSSLLKLVCSSLLKGNTTVKNCLMRRCTYGTLIL